MTGSRAHTLKLFCTILVSLSLSPMHLLSPIHPTFANILDEGHPTSGFPVEYGVPLAPLLFNLALELLVAFRLRLQGVSLPWGSFRGEGQPLLTMSTLVFLQ
jgi:hypothetical protein